MKFFEVVLTNFSKTKKLIKIKCQDHKKNKKIREPFDKIYKNLNILKNVQSRFPKKNISKNILSDFPKKQYLEKCSARFNRKFRKCTVKYF